MSVWYFERGVTLFATLTESSESISREKYTEVLAQGGQYFALSNALRSTHAAVKNQEYITSFLRSYQKESTDAPGVDSILEPRLNTLKRLQQDKGDLTRLDGTTGQASQRDTLQQMIANDPSLKRLGDTQEYDY
jgi:hypothetical protein